VGVLGELAALQNGVVAVNNVRVQLLRIFPQATALSDGCARLGRRDCFRLVSGYWIFG
jgi:hypothetical protein